jgi:hypothetical protein
MQHFPLLTCQNLMLEKAVIHYSLSLALNFLHVFGWLFDDAVSMDTTYEPIIVRQVNDELEMI